MSTTGHLDDEQLTALQDGDGTAGDRAHLEGCDACLARADALSTAATLVGAPPAAPSREAREAAVAAALRASDRPGTPVRSRPRPRVPAWLAPAAAVVALLALVAAVVPQLGTRDDNDSAASGSDAAAQSGDDDAAESSAGSLQDDNAMRLPAVPSADLGAVDEEAELVRRVDGAMDVQAAEDASPPAAAQDAGCASAFRQAGAGFGPVRFSAPLTWKGQPAEVLSDGDRAVVMAAGGCTPLATVDLP